MGVSMSMSMVRSEGSTVTVDVSCVGVVVEEGGKVGGWDVSVGS